MLQTSLSIKMAGFSIATCETGKTLLNRNHPGTKRDIHVSLFLFILPARSARALSLSLYISHPFRLKAPNAS
jgi:hypothetical protein